MMGKPSVCETTPDQASASGCVPYTHTMHICKKNCRRCLSWRRPDLWFVSHGFVPGSRLSSAWVRPRGCGSRRSPRSCISRGSSRKNVRAHARGLSARALYHGEPEVRPGRGLAEEEPSGHTLTSAARATPRSPRERGDVELALSVAPPVVEGKRVHRVDFDQAARRGAKLRMRPELPRPRDEEGKHVRRAGDGLGRVEEDVPIGRRLAYADDGANFARS